MNRKKVSDKKVTPVNGALAQERRKALGMTQQELADAHPKISEGTIAKAERGETISLRLAQLLAKKLGVEYEQLTGTDNNSPSRKSGARRDSLTIERDQDGRIYVTTVVKVEPEDDIRSQAQKLFAQIAKFVGLKDGYDPETMKVKKGSLEITVALTKRDADKLMRATRVGELEQFHVWIVREDYPPGHTKYNAGYVIKSIIKGPSADKFFKKELKERQRKLKEKKYGITKKSKSKKSPPS